MFERFRTKLRRNLLTGGMLALVAALVLVGLDSGDLVSAQSNAGTPTTGAASTTPATTSPATQYPAIVNALAKDLGISPAKVEAALKDVLGQGRLNGIFGRGGMFGGRQHGRANRPTQRVVIVRGIGSKALQTEIANLAKFYGETPAALRSELAQGMTLAQIAQKHGKTADQLKTFLTQQFQSHLDSLINRSFGPKRAAPAAPTTPTTPATPAAEATPMM